MPLMHGKSEKSFSHNVEAEMDAGKPQKQSLAIAYALKRKAKKMADGGMVVEEERSGYEPMPHDESKENMKAEDEDDDMIDSIMRKHFSKGGRAANDTPVTADFEDNDFDDLVKRDDLESSYTGANSGDELGDDEHDKEDEDMISQIMRSRSKKDRMPRPA